VSVSGAVGFVGLIVPHMMRFIFGSDHRTLLPTAALGGAIAMVIADTLARIVVAPNELPVGAVTAVVGAPLFIYLLLRRLARVPAAVPPLRSLLRSPPAWERRSVSPSSRSVTLILQIQRKPRSSLWKPPASRLAPVRSWPFSGPTPAA